MHTLSQRILIRKRTQVTEVRRIYSSTELLYLSKTSRLRMTILDMKLVSNGGLTVYQRARSHQTLSHFKHTLNTSNDYRSNTAPSINSISMCQLRFHQLKFALQLIAATGHSRKMN